jgi:hypothetical protein
VLAKLCPRRNQSLAPTVKGLLIAVLRKVLMPSRILFDPDPPNVSSKLLNLSIRITSRMLSILECSAEDIADSIHELKKCIFSSLVRISWLFLALMLSFYVSWSGFYFQALTTTKYRVRNGQGKHNGHICTASLKCKRLFLIAIAIQGISNRRIMRVDEVMD